MNASPVEKTLLVYFRVLMGWTFLYAASHQLFDPKFSASGFLEHTKTFHDFFVLFAAPAVRPVTDFLVEWGHFLIGLSLLSGLLVRVSGVFGIFLLITYYFAHMDFPYIESKLNFIVDYHIVYAILCVYLATEHAGHVWGLDAWAANLSLFKRNPLLRPLVA